MPQSCATSLKHLLISGYGPPPERNLGNCAWRGTALHRGVSRTMGGECTEGWTDVETGVLRSSMKSVDRIRLTTNGRWIELLDELYQRRDLLADRFMMEIQGGDLYYEDRVEPEELRETSKSAFDFLLGELRGRATGGPVRADSDVAIDFPRRVGTRRARQGVEAQKLTAAIHEDFGVLWSSLLWLSSQEDALTLAVHVQDVWRAVDAFAGRIHNAFTEERMIMTQENSISKQSFVALLLSDDPQPAGLWARASASLSIPEDGRLWVAAAVSTADVDLRLFAEQLRRQGDRLTATRWVGAR